MKLYGYWRSSASYRVRIGLNLKGIAYENVPVHLARGGGEQHGAAFAAINPQSQVPALELDDGSVLTQSLAILEYLDEAYAEPSLLPAEAGRRAFSRALALTIACDIHPLDNLRVLAYLGAELGADEAQKLGWYRHWIHQGFTAMETLLGRAGHQGGFCVGEAPSLADVCLVPQLYNARRFEVDLSAFPLLTAIEAHCLQLDAFAAAVPERQPDADPAAS